LQSFIHLCIFLSCLSTRQPRIPTLFPYTTLFRSGLPQLYMACLREPARMKTEFEQFYRPAAGLIEFDGSGELSKTTVSLLLTFRDRKSTRLNSSHVSISYAVFCLQKKKIEAPNTD